MTQTQNGSICAEEYVVKRGDSFYLIAHKLGVPLRDLLAANRDIHPARLMVGDVLCIPREEDDRPQGGNTGSGNAGSSSNASNSGSASAGNSSNAADNSSAAGNSGSTGGNQQGSGTIPNGNADSSGSTSTGNATNAGNASSTGSNAAGSGNTSDNGTAIPPVTPPPAAPVPGLACPIEEQVTITQGQTIADIQLQNLLSRNTLQTANPAVDLDTLEAGQTICVPTENIACQLPPTYTLAAGETLEAVAMRFNLPLGSLLRVNPCLAPQDFEEGVTVILPR